MLTGQDFDTVIIGKKNLHKQPPSDTAIRCSQRTQASSIATKLDHDDMGSDTFDKHYKNMEDKHKSFRQKFINARIQRNMNQKEFATMLNIKKEDVQRIESGRVKTEASLMQRLLNKL